MMPTEKKSYICPLCLGVCRTPGGQRDGIVMLLREPLPAAGFSSPYCGIKGVAPGVCGGKAFWEDDETNSVAGGFGSVCCYFLDAFLDEADGCYLYHSNFDGLGTHFVK